MNIEVSCIINIFTIVNGDIYLLVNNDKKLLEVKCNDNLDLVCNEYIKKNIKIDNLNLKQVYTFSEKKDNFKLEILYIDIINIDNIKLNDNFVFIELNELKNNKFVIKSIEYLKKYLVLNSSIIKIYPKEFILPDIQKLYENLLEKKYDRRNFRKKLINLDVIEDLNKFSTNKNGRPAKVYKFKELKSDKILF